jgi:beta-galactosidase
MGLRKRLTPLADSDRHENPNPPAPMKAPLLTMKKLAWLMAAFALTAPQLSAQRQMTDVDTDWKFILKDAAPDAAVADWGNVTLPHTWNNLDGQDGRTPGAERRPNEHGGADYYRGVGWYERMLEIPASWQGKRVFVRFEAASEVATVYLNGQQVGEHRGSFTAFCIELTPKLKFGQTNELRVRVDNSLTRTVAPLNGDFNVDGGIYRPAHLLVTDPICVTPLDYASPGVYLTTKKLEDASAEVEVRTMVSNGSPKAETVTVVTAVKDAAGQTVATNTTTLEAPAGGAAQTVAQTVTVANPHRWNGEKDPYLYTASVTVQVNGQAVDAVEQPLGLRTVAITDAQGFLLNGQPYPIHGVDRHQDLKDHGWAMQAEDHARDLQLMLGMGVTAIRLAHYPQSEYFHSLCDAAGMLLWNEVPFVNEVAYPKAAAGNETADNQAFQANLDQQMREMILQRYNHPAVAFWGLFNELGTGATDTAALPTVQHLNAVAHELDPTRITVAASNHPGNKTNLVADRMCYNVYPGWYADEQKGTMAALIDTRFNEQGGHRIGLSEYGAGANPAQHAEGNLTQPKANNGPVHPEEWQTHVHERDWADIQNNPKLWGTFIWVMFDFASDSRNEGSRPGINDKGLVTQDRQIKKDVYYFYQANWTQAPMAYIASRRSTQRREGTTTVQVFSNCAEVELTVNGKSLGMVAPNAIKVAEWQDVALQLNANHIVATGTANGTTVTDGCDWTYEPLPKGKQPGE